MNKQCPLCGKPYKRTRLLKSVAETRRIFQHVLGACKGNIGQHFTMVTTSVAR